MWLASEQTDFPTKHIGLRWSLAAVAILVAPIVESNLGFLNQIEPICLQYAPILAAPIDYGHAAPLAAASLGYGYGKILGAAPLDWGHDGY